MIEVNIILNLHHYWFAERSVNAAANSVCKSWLYESRQVKRNIVSDCRWTFHTSQLFSVKWVVCSSSTHGPARPHLPHSLQQELSSSPTEEGTSHSDWLKVASTLENVGDWNNQNLEAAEWEGWC